MSTEIERISGKMETEMADRKGRPYQGGNSGMSERMDSGMSGGLAKGMSGGINVESDMPLDGASVGWVDKC